MVKAEIRGATDLSNLAGLDTCLGWRWCRGGGGGGGGGDGRRRWGAARRRSLSIKGVWSGGERG
eukprot:1051104-Alexandrium_andersonii.AAC.1